MVPRTPRSLVPLLAVTAALVGFVVATAPAATADTSVGPGLVLAPGQTLTSAANGYRLVMQADGNLVQYTDHGVALWYTGTGGRGASTLVLQSDGNLVVRTMAGVPTWNSRTHGATRLSLQNDGNMVLYTPARAVWCTCTIPFRRIVGQPASLTAGQGMLAGDSLVAGDTRLTLQGDGNLVLVKANRALWSTRTAGGVRSKFTLQGDGNLVVIGPDKRVLWTSRTTGGRTLKVGSDGSLKLLTASGALVWGVGGAATPTGIAGDVFALLNRQRAANGLPALVSDPRLITSASRHNSAMSAANTLSHQLPGEADFGARITAAGYSWRYAAENIAYTTNTTSAGAQAMQTAMYNETPPNDGHRQNILSRTAVHVGVAVLIDARGKLWLTTDFGAPR